VPPRHRPPHLPLSVISRLLDPKRVEPLLEPFVTDPADRAFIVRCVIGEGPVHHRGANWVLLALLGEVLQRCPPGETTQSAQRSPVSMRLPPHLEEEIDEGHWPLELDLEPLRALASDEGRALDAMVDCLVDGPPQHALANVLMVNLLGAILRRQAGK
jgi:hypothetical protein